MSEVRTRWPLALVLSVAAVAAVGCGSSSSGKSGAKSPAASTPATAATDTAPVAPKDPITSPAVKQFVAKSIEPAGASPTEAAKFANCEITKLETQGVKTAREFVKVDKAAVIHECASSLGLHLHVPANG